MATKAVTSDEVKTKEGSISFYMTNCKRFRTIANYKGFKLIIEGNNSVVKINPSDPLFKEKVAFMRESPKNKANGGADFIELSDSDLNSKENIVDSLMLLDKDGLIKVLENPKTEDRLLSIGSLILKIIKEKGIV